MSTYIHTPSSTHTHTIILLHGRDSIASEFASELFESQASDGRTLPEIFPSIKFISPSSKPRLSSRFGSEMSQWFDIWSVESPSEKEELQIEGLKESVRQILEVIREEVGLVGKEKVFLGGISQGCATAIWGLICGGVRLGGFVGLCSWLPFQERVASIASDSKSGERVRGVRALLVDLPSRDELNEEVKEVLDTPVFLGHCWDDEIVSVEEGWKMERTLRDIGFKVTWKVYPDGGHWLNEPQGVDDIVDFLSSKL